MELDPIARLTRLEQLRRSGVPVGPESLSDGLEGAASPLAVDATGIDAVQVAPPISEDEVFARQEARAKTDDYRRERALYRVAQRTGMPVAELMQQPEWAGVGEARAESSMVPVQSRAAMAQKRIEDEATRMEKWKSQMMLASSNSRANMSNAFDMLSPEQKQRVIETRLTGGRNYNSDPRMAIAQLDAETRRAEGQDARASAAEIAAANREAAREERDAVREENTLKYTSAQDEGRQRHEALMEQGRQQFEAMIEKTRSGREDAAHGHEIALKNIEALMAKNKSDMETSLKATQLQASGRVQEAEIAASATETKIAADGAQRDNSMKLLQQKQREAEAVALAGPGGVHLLQGQYGTPDAQDSLDAIAAKSDKSWLGFTTDDAKRMDAVLIRLGVTDPAVRKELVTRHGMGVEAPGQRARGSAHSRMWYPHPEYAPVPPAE